jgi:hypothetical protein
MFISKNEVKKREERKKQEDYDTSKQEVEKKGK